MPIYPEGVVHFTANSASGSKYYTLSGDVESFGYVAAYVQPNVPILSYIEVDHNSLKVSTYVTDTMELVDSYSIKKFATEKHHKH